MIKNFEEVKRQLSELSSVINSYQSETVQLRIVELVLGGVPDNAPDPNQEAESGSPPPPPSKGKARRRAKNQRAEEQPAAPATPTKTGSRPGRPGPIATLAKLLGEGFFKKGKTLSEIVAHCETKLATHYKQSNLSGPLIRMVRDQKLSREKNAEGQYVYQQT